MAKGPMDKKKLEYYKKRLVTKREELERLVMRTELDGRSTDEETPQDAADKAANSYNKEFLFSQSDHDRFVLQLVEEALNRMEQGNYGECVACGGEMQQKRLEAVPWARHCIPCQEKQEKEEL
jgi:DnaK suppressor protein